VYFSPYIRRIFISQLLRMDRLSYRQIFNAKPGLANLIISNKPADRMGNLRNMKPASRADAEANPTQPRQKSVPSTKICPVHGRVGMGIRHTGRPAKWGSETPPTSAQKSFPLFLLSQSGNFAQSIKF